MGGKMNNGITNRFIFTGLGSKIFLSNLGGISKCGLNTIDFGNGGG
jgi:hypothetical protein